MTPSGVQGARAVHEDVVERRAQPNGKRTYEHGGFAEARELDSRRIRDPRCQQPAHRCQEQVTVRTEPAAENDERGIRDRGDWRDLRRDAPSNFVDNCAPQGIAASCGGENGSAQREMRVKEVAKLLGLSDYLEGKPGQLSGGQRQRVAMGRAIVRVPSVFLMDEPLSNLDAKLRVQMRADIAALQADFGITIVYVTHDQSEAMTLGHRVAVLHEGHLQQCGPPRELYERPTNIFVAGFIGSPAMNLCAVPVSNGAASFGGWTCRFRRASPSTGERVS